jgi:hypothetical protein
MIRKVFVIGMCLIYLTACHPIYYTTTPKELANQLSKAKIIKEINPFNFLRVGSATFKEREYIIRNNLVKLYLYDEEGKGDSIDVSFVNVKYITKYGESEYSPIIYESFKDNYFITLYETTFQKKLNVNFARYIKIQLLK